MAGDAFAAVKDLDRGDSDPRLDFLPDQLVRHAVVVLGDLDMSSLLFSPNGLSQACFASMIERRIARVWSNQLYSVSPSPRRMAR